MNIGVADMPEKRVSSGVSFSLMSVIFVSDRGSDMAIEVCVSDVDAMSPAHRAGLRRGDIIKKVKTVTKEVSVSKNNLHDINKTAIRRQIAGPMSHRCHPRLFVIWYGFAELEIFREADGLQNFICLNFRMCLFSNLSLRVASIRRALCNHLKEWNRLKGAGLNLCVGTV